MRTGPLWFLSAQRTAMMAALLAALVFVLFFSGIGLVTADEFSDTGEHLAWTPAWMDVPAPGLLLAFMVGVSILILSLAFRGGRPGNGSFNNRTPGSTSVLSGMVFFVAALCRAVILFLQP